MKSLGIFFFAVLLSSFSMAQSLKLRKADKLYNHLGYAEAAVLYEELWDKGNRDPFMLAKWADCYYQQGLTLRAEPIYAEMIHDVAATPEDYYRYAQSLKENGKYEESNKWMNIFYQKNRADFRAIEFKRKENQVQAILDKGEKFKIKNLEVNTPKKDFGGYINPSSQAVYFVSNRYENPMVHNTYTWTNEPFLDLYKGLRGDSNSIQDPIRSKHKVNSKYHEGPLAFTPDGRFVFFSRNNLGRGFEGKKDENGIQNLKMYYGKVDEKGNWFDIKEVPFNNREYSVGHPTISKKGDWMYFVSDMPAGIGGADIYKIQLNQGDNDLIFGTAINLGVDINTEGQEMFPFLDSLGNLYFSSDGHVGLGGLDIYVALNALNKEKLTFENIGIPVNSSKDDFAFTMYKDNQTGYFSSNRNTGKGDDDIYSFVMLEPIQQQLVLQGVVIDVKTREILPNSTVRLKDGEGKVVANTTADEKGKYSFPVNREKSYELVGEKEGYMPQKNVAFTYNLPAGTEYLTRDLELNKTAGVSLYALVTNKQTGEPLDKARLKVVDLNNQEVILNLRTGETGDAFRGLENEVGDCLNYQVVIAKEGFLGKTLPFKYCIKEPGTILMQESLDIALQPIEIGMDLGKFIDIRPIYFDLDKYNIRPDAARELDKIVEVMMEHPTMEIELGSHTDCRASAAYNEKLSDQRARASAEYVRQRITNPQRIYGKGYGESRLVNDCACEGNQKSNCTEAEHQMNRRTEFIIVRM